MKNRFISTLFILGLLITTDADAGIQPAAAAETKAFVYEAKRQRDPFMSLVDEEGKIASSYGTIESIADVKLEGIAYDPHGDSVVIINGLVLKKDQKFDNIELIEIQPDKVILRFNDDEYSIYLKKE